MENVYILEWWKMQKPEYKKLRYSEIELSNNKVKYYVYSELQ